MHTLALKQEQETKSTSFAGLSRTFPASTPETSRIQRTCACGGGCPACLNKSNAREQSFAIQKKSLEISSPVDADEKEADEVARKVVNGQPAEIYQTSATVNRKGEGSAETTPEFQSKLENSKGGGQSLDASTRSEMESKMGADFSNVKIHINSEAHNLNESISAQAFTHGKDIYFRNGNYNPGLRQGKELLAHELAHTLQQGKSVKKRIQRQPIPQTHWQIDRSKEGKVIYFNTEAEANTRKEELEKEGRWEQYNIKSFTVNGKTFWRVQMRGTRTMNNFLTVLRKAEQAYPGLTKEQMLNSLRRLAGYDTEKFQDFYGTTAATKIDVIPEGLVELKSVQDGAADAHTVAVPIPGFSAEDVQMLRDMLRHDGSDEKEVGIVKDFSGEYLAMGHVMCGISGGLHRNRKADIVPWYGAAGGEKMDNVYATTLSGDLGQSAVLVNEGAQKGFVGKGTEATSAELVGDIDGVIIGEALAAAAFKGKWDAAKTLSDFIEMYYKSDLSKTRFSIASKFFDQSYVKDQITRFAETYAYREGGFSGTASGACSEVGTESEAAYKAYQEWLSDKKKTEEMKTKKKEIKETKKMTSTPIHDWDR